MRAIIKGLVIKSVVERRWHGKANGKSRMMAGIVQSGQASHPAAGCPYAREKAQIM
jgi:hypothetical protein